MKWLCKFVELLRLYNIYMFTLEPRMEEFVHQIPLPRDTMSDRRGAWKDGLL